MTKILNTLTNLFPCIEFKIIKQGITYDRDSMDDSDTLKLLQWFKYESPSTVSSITWSQKTGHLLKISN